MKILNREQIRATDMFTIKNEPVTSIDLMERAATRFYDKFLEWLNPQKKIFVFCGKGNNGGDGLALCRLLYQVGKDVTTCIVHYSDKSSDDFDINLKRLPPGIPVIHIHSADDFPDDCRGCFLVDALWGTGLTRPVQGFARDIIQKINNSGRPVVGLDIASGTYCDSFNRDDAKIRADYTISFNPPKLAFFIPENQNFIGEWACVDIGLDREFIDSRDSVYYFSEPKEIRSLFKPRKPFDHKGIFGHALVVGGSLGKAGAVILASRAALRTGAGLVSAHVPACAYPVMQTAVPEAMVFVDTEKEVVSKITSLENITAIGFGPGVGKDAKTMMALRQLLEMAKQPLVIDADGLNLLSENKSLLNRLPSNTILTPHIGEFGRLAGKCNNHFERLGLLKEFCEKYQCITILKGRFSCICTPDGKLYFNATGNPGMATGGSGDVLTGIITGFLAQGETALNAAVKGVYLHGLAGDLARDNRTEEALIAGDIIDYLPSAFNEIHTTNLQAIEMKNG